LIIIDCQNDFIDGSLVVPGAKQAVQNIVNIMDNYDEYILTTDLHSLRHCSFNINGGPWPLHCVEGTEGSCIHKDIMAKLLEAHNKGKQYSILHKGEVDDVEEYGGFTSINWIGGGVLRFRSITHAAYSTASEFTICGLAGDYCVLETIKQCCNIDLSVYLPGIASIDGGTKLNDYLLEHDEITRISN